MDNHSIIKFLKDIENKKRTVAIDFDGVIHKNSLGFHDGTIYDIPIDGTKEALEFLSKIFSKIIIFTCKSVSRRPLINGMTGTELIWEWLKKNNLDKYIFDVTAEKPIAAIYIDDNAIRFTNWKETIEYIKQLLDKNIKI